MQLKTVAFWIILSVDVIALVKSQVDENKDLDDFLSNCQAIDDKQRLLTCDATKAVAPLKCIWQKKVGLGRVSAMSESQFTAYHQYGEFIFEVGARLWFLHANFKSTIGYSTRTSHSWESYEKTTWSEEQTTTIEMEAPPGCRTMVNEIVGTCSFIIVRPNYFERVDDCNDEFTLTNEILSANDQRGVYQSKIPCSLTKEPESCNDNEQNHNFANKRNTSQTFMSYLLISFLLVLAK